MVTPPDKAADGSAEAAADGPTDGTTVGAELASPAPHAAATTRAATDRLRGRIERDNRGLRELTASWSEVGWYEGQPDFVNGSCHS